MANISLEKFISNLKEIRSEGLPSILKSEILDIYYEVLYEIAKQTLTDTGQSRASVISDFLKQYGYSDKGLFDEFYNYWEYNGFPENRFRDKNSYNSNLTETLNKQEFNVSIAIRDEGLFAQEHASSTGYYNGKQYPSEKLAEDMGRDNSKFPINHISLVSDSWIKNPTVKEIYERMTERVRKRLFK
jgi:hypothetical protein